MEELRIVLVGKTGVGKSACGNTILGRKEFKSVLSPASVTTQSTKARAEVDGRDVYVVDTPGLYDTTHNTSDELIKEIGKCICLSSPGPHVILVVVQLGRFTQEEQDSVKKIQEIFGQHAAKYTMVLFSYGEGLEDTTIEEFISLSEALREFTAQCLGGCHVFRNKAPENHSQVTELLQRIDQMVTRNGGGYYTNEMFQRAEAAIEKEKLRILKETEEKRKKEEEKLKQFIKNKEDLEKALEELQEAEEEKARLRAELENDFTRSYMKTGSIVGGVVGAVGGAVAGGIKGVGAGVAAGPGGAVVGGVIGAAAGVVVGVAGGAGVGALVGSAAKKEN